MVATVVTAVEEAAERLSDEAKVTKAIEIAMRYDLIEIEVEAVHMIEGTTVENDRGVEIVTVVTFWDTPRSLRSMRAAQTKEKKW
jgi:hypothetical protein